MPVTNASANKTIDNLPAELIIHILKKMKVKDALRLAQTSKRYRDILTAPENQFWKHYLHRDFPEVVQPISDSNYKALYQESFNKKEIKKEINNLAAVIDFITSFKVELSLFWDPREREFASIKAKINAVSPSATIAELRALRHEVTIAVSNSNIHTRIGLTPLMLALREGQTNIALALIHAGANLNTVDQSGNTAQHPKVTQISLSLLSRRGRI